MATLVVSVLQGRQLVNVESGGGGLSLFKSSKEERKSDPYAVVVYKGQKFQTKVIDNNLDPQWGEEFTFKLKEAFDSTSYVEIEVYDYNKISSKVLLGKCAVPLAPLSSAESSQTWYKLKDKNGTQINSEVEVALQLNDPNRKPSSSDASGGAAGAVDVEQGGDADDGTGDAPADGSNPVDKSGGAHAAKRRLAGVDPAGNRLEIEGRLRKRNTDLSTKPTEFQVRIHVIEARHIQATGIDPVVKVVVSNQDKHTRVHKTTVSPFYDEHMMFNFTDSPAKLFEELVTFQVYNSRMLRKDAFIGGFSLDIGFIYEQPKHQFGRTWLMLTNKDTAVMGYLKVSVTVLGPGDELSVPEEKPNEDDDFEQHVLRPTGAELETVDLRVRVFSAQDVPQKDASLKTGIKALDKFTGQDNKMDCDPYMRVSFAGKLVMSKVINNTYFPDWKDELHVAVQMPSFCDRIRLQLWDSDTLALIANSSMNRLKFADDLIATAYLDIKSISSNDIDFGFLPSFGPAFVNFYGSGRQFEVISSDHSKKLDEGIGEGYAFRGRALIQFDSDPVSDPSKIGVHGEIHKTDVEAALASLQPTSYLLRLMISDVTMLNKEEFRREVSFEVSIGTIGNINYLDEEDSSAHCLSFPAVPVFDGISSNFVPWDNKKPCLEYESKWEVVAFRIHALNNIRAINARLETSVRAIETLLREANEVKDTDVQNSKQLRAKAALVKTTETLITDCSKPLKALPDVLSTRLDVFMHRYRDEQRNESVLICQEMLDSFNKGDITTEEAFEVLETRLRVLVSLAVEAQANIPDIIVSVLHKGERRAYVRIPVIDYFFSSEKDECGPFFGKSRTFCLRSTNSGPKKPSEDILPGMIQMRVWFGETEEAKNWPQQDGVFVAIAESYENERRAFGKWSSGNLSSALGDPMAFSDKRGKVAKNRESYYLPNGWKWNGDWYVDPPLPDIDVYGDQDTVIIEVFELERRYPLTGWSKTLLATDPPAWSDKNYQEERTMDSYVLPPGWVYTTEKWNIDTARDVDEEGWEYAFNFTSSFHKQSRRIDWVRRRRHYIERKRDANAVAAPSTSTAVTKVTSGKSREALDHGEGWTYSGSFSQDGRSTARAMDFFRRRRWHREFFAESSANFGYRSMPAKWGVAGTFLAYKQTQHYQVRAHVYQARDLAAADSNGLSDPFVRIHFGPLAGKTNIIAETLTPTWDEVIVLSNIALHGNYSDPKELIDDLATQVSVEVWDYDKIGKDDFLGRCTAMPVFRSRSSPNPAVLEWFPLKRMDQHEGDILAAFEIIPMSDVGYFPLPHEVEVTDPFNSFRKCPTIRLPEDVRPEMQKCRVRVLTWGLRSLAKVQLLSVSEPHISFECGGVQKESSVIKSFKEHPNFAMDELFFDVNLPVKEIYAPPLNIRVFDNRKFGNRPLVGSTSIKSLAVYNRDLSTLGKTPQAVQDLYYQDLARKAAEKRAALEALANADAIHRATVAPDLTPGASSADITAALSKPPSTPGNGADIEMLPVEDGADLPGSAGPSPSASPSATAGTSTTLNTPRTPSTALLPVPVDTAATVATSDYRKVSTIVDIAALAKSKAIAQAVSLGKMLQKLAGDDPEAMLDKEVVLDWWSKFYTSANHDEAGPKYEGDKIQVLDHPLESVYDLADQIDTFVISKGSDEHRTKTGVFKGNFAVFILDGAGRDPTEYDADGKPIQVKAEAVKAKSVVAKSMERIGLRRRVSRRENEKRASFGQDSNKDIIHKIWPSLPDKSSVEVLVRLYLVRGLELTPRDDNGLSDPFVIVTFGKNKPLNDKKNYIARNLNPVFGRVFEQVCTLPRDGELTIEVFDYDMLSANDLIGITKIDLEQRWLSSKRGNSGLARSYQPRGINRWRDSQKPSEILFEWCQHHNLPPPVYETTDDDEFNVLIRGYNGDQPFVAPDEVPTLTVEDAIKDDEYDEVMKENAALVALHSTGMVKEHIETRPLFHPSQPDLEQGKLQLWVDMFLARPGIPHPPPVDITPRKPKGYVLRVIVWNTAECDLKDTAITGEKMSDLYVKGFMRGMEKQKQKTDVHYRSLDGEGNFNWRMCFPFKYQPAEETMVIERKPHVFSREVEIVKVPSILSLQIWDADVFHSDDYIGSVEIDLNHFAKPGTRVDNATHITDDDLSTKNTVSLFRKRRARGWYCVTMREDLEEDRKARLAKAKKAAKKGKKGAKALTEPEPKAPERVSGKIEIELEILTEEEALERPAGQAREEPNQYPVLEPPNRPATSFFWFTSPWKSFKYIVWKHYKWYIIIFLLLVLLGLLIFLFIYTAPAALMNGIVQRINAAATAAKTDVTIVYNATAGALS